MILYLRKGVNYYMKKRNTAIRALSVFLAYAMVYTSVPAAGQEMFGSGVNRETEDAVLVEFLVMFQTDFTILF